MIWIAQILVAREATRMGTLATVKARGMLFTRVVAWVARLRFRLPPSNTISPSSCILSNRLVWSEECGRVTSSTC